MRLTAVLLAWAILATTSTSAAADQQTTQATSVQGRARSISVETDVRQIAMSASLVLAGYAAESNSPESASLRERIRTELSTLPADLRSQLSTFYAQHRRSGVDEAVDAQR